MRMPDRESMGYIFSALLSGEFYLWTACVLQDFDRVVVQTITTCGRFR